MRRTSPRAEPDGRPRRQPGWPMRIVWFVGLWLASIAALGAVASIIRFWLVG